MLRKYFNLLAVFFVMILVVSCSDDDSSGPSDSESQTVVEYVESTNDYINTNAPAIMPAEKVKTAMATDDVYIMDIRAAEHYAEGHIEGAENVAWNDIITHVEGLDLEDGVDIAVVCYSGQSAAYATSLLRLLGHDNVYSMKFGMCSWSQETIGSWENNAKSGFESDFVTEVTEKPAKGSLPVIETGKSTGKEILRARVEQVLAERFDEGAIGNATVTGAKDMYHIVNYWNMDHYQDPGHIEGAMQYTPKESLKYDTDLTTLPADKPVVIYCYTGQTSANVAAYLRVLGYNAKSLKFGTSGMILNSLPEGFPKWSSSACMGYEIVK